MISLYSIAQENYSHDPVTKPLRYYEVFEQALQAESLTPRTILEIGVYYGESTKVLARRFPDAHIVALDLKQRDIDFSGYKNIRYLQCDQTDGAKLKSICEQNFPEGLDLVIEDASHIGHLSKLTFQSVYPYLSSGGLYIIEDWGTGYWQSWIDGEGFTDCAVPVSAARIVKSIHSHNAGMVGFVKSLVDYTAVDDIVDSRANAGSWASRLILSAGRMAILRKAVEHMPRLRFWIDGFLAPGTNAAASSGTQTKAEPPRLKSLKFARGVCIACKA